MQASCGKNCKWSRELGQVFSAGWQRLREPAGDWPSVRPSSRGASLCSKGSFRSAYLGVLFVCKVLSLSQSLSDTPPSLPVAPVYVLDPTYTAMHCSFLSYFICVSSVTTQKTELNNPHFCCRVLQIKWRKWVHIPLKKHLCPSLSTLHLPDTQTFQRKWKKKLKLSRAETDHQGIHN